jgi:hypothetical protein
VASIPWYREPGSPVEIWLGLPDWVTVALGCYVVAAVLNALAWYRSDVPDRETPRPSAETPRPSEREGP